MSSVFSLKVSRARRWSCRASEPPRAWLTFRAIARLRFSLTARTMQGHVVIFRDLDQRLRVLRRARPPNPGPACEFGADAVFQADAARDLLHVGADFSETSAEFVDEGDSRDECVGG